MKKVSILLFAFIILLGTVGFIPSLANAVPVSSSYEYNYRDNLSANTVNVGTGDRLTYGSSWVIPNGYNGTTGVAQQISSLGTLEQLLYLLYR